MSTRKSTRNQQFEARQRAAGLVKVSTWVPAHRAAEMHETARAFRLLGMSAGNGTWVRLANGRLFPAARVRVPTATLVSAEVALDTTKP